jgi:hypothetical protein
MILALISYLVASSFCDAPGFRLGLVDANDLVDRVKHFDFGQTLVNLGHHLEKPSQQSIMVNLWSKLGQTLVKPLLKAFDIHGHSRTFAAFSKFHLDTSNYPNTKVV